MNITLPEETIRLLDRIAKGDRSRVIAEALERCVVDVRRSNLRRRIKEGARRRAGRDLKLAEDWFSLDEEASPSDKR